METEAANWTKVREFEELLYEKCEGIAKVTINRPHRRNAFTPDTVAEMIEAFTDAGLPTGDILAQWPEGTLTDDALFEYLADDPEAEGRVDAGDVESVTEIVREVARLRMAMDRADSMGVELPASVEAEIYREWDDRIYRWTSALGFRPGLTSTQIKEAAGSALARTGQAADIARREYRPFGSILLEFYGVSWGEADD